MRERSTRRVMGGCCVVRVQHLSDLRRARPAAPPPPARPGAPCAPRACGPRVRRARRARRRSGAAPRWSSPAALGSPSRRAASTAACTVSSGALREYSTWCAAAASSERSGLAHAGGAAEQGLERRHEPQVPAQRAEGDGAHRGALGRGLGRGQRRIGGLRRRTATASMARAAAASAGAPGAQGVLAKAATLQCTGCARSRARATGLRPGCWTWVTSSTPCAAADGEEIVLNPQDRARFGTFRRHLRRRSATFGPSRCAAARRPAASRPRARD